MHAHLNAYSWLIDPESIGAAMQVAADGLTALACYSIPATLAYLAWTRRPTAFPRIVWVLAGFLLACGTTHLVAL